MAELGRRLGGVSGWAGDSLGESGRVFDLLSLLLCEAGRQLGSGWAGRQAGRAGRSLGESGRVLELLPLLLREAGRGRQRDRLQLTRHFVLGHLRAFYSLPLHPPVLEPDFHLQKEIEYTFNEVAKEQSDDRTDTELCD